MNQTGVKGKKNDLLIAPLINIIMTVATPSMHIILGVLIPLWPILTSSPGLRCCASSFRQSLQTVRRPLLCSTCDRFQSARRTYADDSSSAEEKEESAELSFVGCFVLRSAPSNFCRAKLASLATFLGTPINRRFILGSGDACLNWITAFFFLGGQKGKKLDVGWLCLGYEQARRRLAASERSITVSVWDSLVTAAGQAGSGGLVASSKQDTSSMQTTIHVLHLG
jgi:hypothetical protein